jgi:hypothetical protein
VLEDKMDTLNRSAIVVKPTQPFLDWLHAADPTSLHLTLRDLLREPTIYLIPECDTEEDVAEALDKLCGEIFEEQLAGWYSDISTWPRDRSYEVFCQWFDYQHHSMLVDLCNEPLIYG